MDILAKLLPFIGQFNEQQNSRMATQEARQWQEDMYNKYNSPSALVRQYDEAGINPALMFGGQTPAAPTETQAAAVAPNPSGSLTDMLGQLMNLSLLSEERRLKKASADKLEAEKTAQDIENEFRPRILEQSIEKGDLDIVQAQQAISRFDDELRELRARTRELNSRSELNAANAVLAIAQQTLVGLQGEQVSLQNWRLDFENKFTEEFGIKPDEPIWNSLTGMLGKSSRLLAGGDALMNPLFDLGKKSFDFFKKNSIFGYGKYYGP